MGRNEVAHKLTIEQLTPSAGNSNVLRPTPWQLDVIKRRKGKIVVQVYFAHSSNPVIASL
jgi:hypothetical protein